MRLNHIHVEDLSYLLPKDVVTPSETQYNGTCGRKWDYDYRMHRVVLLLFRLHLEIKSGNLPPVEIDRRI